MEQLAKVLILNDYQREADKNSRFGLDGERLSFLRSSLTRNGVFEAEYIIQTLTGNEEETKKLILDFKFNLIVTLGKYPLKWLTDQTSLDKWQLSLLRSRVEFGTQKVLPLVHPQDVFSQSYSSFYFLLGCAKIAKEKDSPNITVPDRIFHLNPTFEETMFFLDRCKEAEYLAVDVETSKCQINTVGLALSPYEAIAIFTLPYKMSSIDTDFTERQYHHLWLKLAEVLESDNKKIFQNYIFDTQYLSKYGVYVENVYHDTMHCNKFIYPELDMDLANVGRIWTPYPYWKDDKGKDWNIVADWKQHFTYNCKDTTGCYYAAMEQIKTLKEMGLDDLFHNFVMKFSSPAREMCTRGLLVDETKLIALREEITTKRDLVLNDMQENFKSRLGKEVNPRSPKQVKTALKELGLVLPTKKDKATGEDKETADKKALLKLRKKHPKEKILTNLIQLSQYNKQISSYVNFQYDTDKRVRYSLGICSTETGRWNSNLDPFDNGFNAQTLPKWLKGIFKADDGKLLVEVDLAQAESRFVAWDSPEPTLMKLINDRRDIHKFVAAEIYKKPEGIITKAERQLGKKSGHGANYGVGPKTFAESCLVEMDMVMNTKEASDIIEAYFRVFPGIRNRQKNIRNEVKLKRTLTTPMGRKRTFYGQLNDGMFREAYAYAPQSTIPDIINCLMLKLYGKVDMLLQIHDALLFQVEEEKLGEILDIVFDLESWHPKIKLAGGQLIIPVDVQYGKYWTNMVQA